MHSCIHYFIAHFLLVLTCNLLNGCRLPGWKVRAAVFASSKAAQLEERITERHLWAFKGAVENAGQEHVEADQPEDNGDADIVAVRQRAYCIQ